MLSPAYYAQCYSGIIGISLSRYKGQKYMHAENVEALQREYKVFFTEMLL